jgi:hypothetical protein
MGPGKGIAGIDSPVVVESVALPIDRDSGGAAGNATIMAVQGMVVPLTVEEGDSVPVLDGTM